MADEMFLSAQLKFTKGTLTDTKGPRSDSFDVSGSVYAGGAQTIGTSHEALVMGDVATAGWAWFANADATNFCTLGVDVAGAFHPFTKLKPGEFYPLRLGTNAPYAKPDTAPVVLQYMIVAD